MGWDCSQALGGLRIYPASAWFWPPTQAPSLLLPGRPRPRETERKAALEMRFPLSTLEMGLGALGSRGREPTKGCQP